MAKHCSGSHAQSFRRKVKSGCRTCKLRKVKCDEAWPVCRRCQSSGRVCDGYGIWGGGGNAHGLQQDRTNDDRATKSKRSPACTQASLIKPVQLMPLATSEQGCFEWYMCRSAVKLPGAFRSDYWTNLLFQASTTEPAIRHAVLALGSAHREEVRGASLRASECNDEQTLFTVRQYSNAINCLQPYFSDSRRSSVRITLVTCVLFVYMEFLRGHYTKGIVHLKHGLSLLQGTGSGLESQDPSSTHIDGWLVTLFTKLLVQAKLLGQILRFPCHNFLDSCLQPSLDTFRSIHHARRSLEHIMLRTFNLQEQSHQLTAATTAELGTDLREYQENIQVELQIWLKTHEATMRNLSPTHGAMEFFASHLLRLYYRLAIILAATCLEGSNELTFDRHESAFSGLVSYCIEIYKIVRPNGKHSVGTHHDPEPSSPNSISDIGWIAPLYFTAIKCRNHRIRHQAIRLLQLTPHKEGIWSATLALLVPRQVLEIEEGNFYDGVETDEFDELSAPTDEDLATPTLPEEFRLSKINIVLPDDRAGKLLLTCCRKERSGVIEWISKEYDLPSRQWNDIAWTTRSRSSRESLT